MRKIIFLLLLLVFNPFYSNAYSEQSIAKQQQKFHFGVITLTHPLIIYRQYLPFIDYLNKHLACEFELVLYKDYAEVVEAIESGKLDMALLGGNSYAQAIKNADLLPIAAVLSRDKTSKTYSIIITKEDNNDINNVQDLKSKSIAFGPTQSTSSYVIPLHFLKNQGITLSDFTKYTNLNTHDAVLRAVLRGDYDAGAIGEAFAQRFLGHSLKIVARTKKFPSFIIVAGADVTAKDRKKVQDLLFSINSQDAEFIKSSLHWPEVLRNGFAPVVEKDYDIFHDLPNS